MTTRRVTSQRNKTVDGQSPTAADGAITTDEAIDLHPEYLEPFRRHRRLAKQLLPFLKSLNDFDIASEIGFHELSGTPLTVKRLLLLNLAPQITVFRRLDRLCTLGVVVRTRATHDKRVHELRLSPAVHQLIAMYCKLDRS